MNSLFSQHFFLGGGGAGEEDVLGLGHISYLQGEANSQPMYKQ